MLTLISQSGSPVGRAVFRFPMVQISALLAVLAAAGGILALSFSMVLLAWINFGVCVVTIVLGVICGLVDEYDVPRVLSWATWLLFPAGAIGAIVVLFTNGYMRWVWIPVAALGLFVGVTLVILYRREVSVRGTAFGRIFEIQAIRQEIEDLRTEFTRTLTRELRTGLDRLAYQQSEFLRSSPMPNFGASELERLARQVAGPINSRIMQALSELQSKPG